MHAINEKKFVNIDQHKMAYIEEGKGDPIVFIHGNATSSYLWRNIIPHVAKYARCIAVDLMGMGDSDKLDTYSFATHQHYLSTFLEKLGINQNVTLMLHDWGSVLGFNWAFNNPLSVEAIAYTESFVAPIESWSDIPHGMRELVKLMRGFLGEKIVLDKNFFIEQILPSGIIRKLTDDEMNEYRRPFLNSSASRRPLLELFRSVPIEKDPAKIYSIIMEYQAWLKQTNLPKLFIEAEPGQIIESHREVAKSFANQKHVKIRGKHFVQEDSPKEIAEALIDWYQSIKSTN